MKCKKIVLFLIVLNLFFIQIINLGSAKAAEKDFSYLVNMDGTITITKYTGYEENVIIPSQIDGRNVTVIGEQAFSAPVNLKSIVIPDKVTTIKQLAFWECSALTKITVPTNVNYIEQPAFGMCNNLTGIYVDNNNKNYKSVDGVLFSKDGTILKEYPEGNIESTYNIPNSVKNIGDYAFLSCKSLANVIISSDVTIIGDGAFALCKGLTNITIPTGVKVIGNKVFFGCSNLSEISVDVNNQKYRSVDGVLFDKDTTILTDYPSGKIGTTYIIPNSVRTINNDAFANCKQLTSITIPDSVTALGEDAFILCDSLKSLYFCGNAPTLIDYDSLIDNLNVYSSKAIIYYKPYSKGFTSPTWKGYTTAVYADNMDELKRALENGLTKKSVEISVYYKGDEREDKSILYGDLDGNKVINSIDLALMKRYMNSTITNFLSVDGLKAADLNGNGTIDKTDQELMKEYLLGIGKKFNAPLDFDKHMSELIETTLREDSNIYCVKTLNYTKRGIPGDMTITFNVIYN